VIPAVNQAVFLTIYPSTTGIPPKTTEKL